MDNAQCGQPIRAGRTRFQCAELEHMRNWAHSFFMHRNQEFYENIIRGFGIKKKRARRAQYDLKNAPQDVKLASWRTGRPLE